MNSTINLHKEHITVENIVPIFHKYGVPTKFDLLSVDLDGLDFYILRRFASLNIIFSATNDASAALASFVAVFKK